MQILIATSNGKKINLEVDSEDSVHQIKQKIHMLEGIPSEQQSLICEGKLLEDLQTIAEYNLEKEFLITLKVNEIKLQIKSIGEANFTVEVEPTDSIKDLKEKIHALKGFSPEEFVLSFKGKKLENDSASVFSSNLKDKSVLMLVKRASKPNLSSSSSPSVVPTPCLNACGFYGNAANKGYCSKCFSDLGLNNNANSNANNSIIADKNNSSNNNNNANIKEENIILENNQIKTAAPEEKKNDEEPKKQVDSSKCWKCSKKIGIYGFQCRCKYFFCEKHRYNDRHNCTFDYTELQRSNLSTKLEKVVERKVGEI